MSGHDTINVIKAPTSCPECGALKHWSRPAEIAWVAPWLCGKGKDAMGTYADYQNDVYHITHRKNDGQEWLVIARIDGSAERDWRDFQRIKNQFFGAEVEAVELYPAESRKIDPSNAFYLWRITGPPRRWGLRGGRFVRAPGFTGAPQRAFRSLIEDKTDGHI